MIKKDACVFVLFTLQGRRAAGRYNMKGNREKQEGVGGILEGAVSSELGQMEKGLDLFRGNDASTISQR